MRVRLRSVSQVLVGVDRVGFVGLELAFERADDTGLGEREELDETRVASNDESLAPRGRDEVRILRGLFA